MRRRTAGLLWLATLGALAACRPGPSESSADAIDREAFIATYVDLRHAALLAPDAALDESGRAAVLARHGVSEEDLLSFVEVHGRDTEFMADVWAEAERRLEEQRQRPDSAA